MPFGGFLSSSDFSLSRKLCPNEKLARERTGWDSGPSLAAVLPGAISGPEWRAGAISRGLPFARLSPAASYLIPPPHVSWQEAPCPEGSTGPAHLDPWHRHLLVSGGEGGHTPRVGVRACSRAELGSRVGPARASRGSGRGCTPVTSRHRFVPEPCLSFKTGTRSAQPPLPVVSAALALPSLRWRRHGHDGRAWREVLGGRMGHTRGLCSEP